MFGPSRSNEAPSSGFLYPAAALDLVRAIPCPARSSARRDHRGVHLGAGLLSTLINVGDPPLSALVFGSRVVAGGDGTLGLCFCLAHQIHRSPGIQLEAGAAAVGLGDRFRPWGRGAAARLCGPNTPSAKS